MNRSTKGAIAAATAGALLLGGAGTLAYWGDSDPVTGATFSSGSLSLASADTCDVWNLDTGEAGGQPFDPATGKIVPGDTVTKVCGFTIDAVGEHLRATVEATPGTDSGALVPALDVAATNLEVEGATVTEITEADDGKELVVTVSVTFDATSDNTTQNLAGALDAIDIVTTQVHG